MRREGWPDKIYFGQNIFRCKFTKYIQVLHQNDVKISLKYNLTRPLKGHQSFLHSNPLLPLPDWIFWFGYYIKSQLIIKLVIIWRLTGPHHNPQASFGQDLSPFEKLTSFLDRTAPQNTNIFSKYILSEYILSEYILSGIYYVRNIFCPNIFCPEYILSEYILSDIFCPNIFCPRILCPVTDFL